MNYCLKNSVRMGGFTLFELLIASSITVFLASLLIWILSTASSTFRKTHGDLSTQVQARIVLDQIEEDLGGAFYRSNGAIWFAVSIEPKFPSVSYLIDHGWQYELKEEPLTHTKRLKPDGSASMSLSNLDLRDTRYGQVGAWLRFFTTYQGRNSSRTNLSSPTVVSFQIARRNVSGTELNNDPSINPAEVRYQLFRSYVRPVVASIDGEDRSGAFEIGYDLNPAFSHGYYDTLNIEFPDDPGAVIRPLSHSLLANNVIDFGIRMYAEGPAGLELIFPEKGGELSDEDLDHFATSDTLISGSGRFPQVVEILLRILTEEGAMQIRNLEAGSVVGDEEEWWRLAQMYSHVYTRRVKLFVKETLR